MLKNILRKSLVVIVCQTLIYSPLIRATGDPVLSPSGDRSPPEISQEKYINTVKRGADYQITVTVTDNVGVQRVILHYRTIGTENYKHKTMDNIVKTDDYRSTIKSYEIKAPGVEYYVEAMDNAGNKSSSAPPKSASLKRASQPTQPPGDKVKPKISHEEKYIDTVKKGADHQITVSVTDNVGVKRVTLYYRTIGTEKYKRKTMDNIVNTDDYHATIKSDQIKDRGVEYYVKAMDNAGNKSGHSAKTFSVKMTDEDVAIVPPPGNLVIDDDESSNTWLWIGLGVLAAGVAVAASSGGDDSEPSTTTLNITASDPTQ